MLVDEIRTLSPEITRRKQDIGHESVSQLGLDSLDIRMLVQHVNTKLGLELPLSIVFEHPTPSDLVAHIFGLLLLRPDGSSSEAAAGGGAAGSECSWPQVSTLLRRAVAGTASAGADVLEREFSDATFSALGVYDIQETARGFVMALNQTFGLELGVGLGSESRVEPRGTDEDAETRIGDPPAIGVRHGVAGLQQAQCWCVRGGCCWARGSLTFIGLSFLS